MDLLTINSVHGGDELKQIKSDIAVLLQQRDDLQELVQNHAPILLSYYFSQLLLGPPEEHDSDARELKKILPREYRYCQVCILIQKSPSGIALSTKPALQVQSALDRPDSVRVYALNQNNRTLLILQYDREEDFSLWLANALNQFPDAFIAPGQAVNSVNTLAVSFTDANRTCDYRLIQSGQRDTVTRNEAKGAYFPFEAETDLMIALQTKNLAKAETLVKKLLDKNRILGGSLNGIYSELEHLIRTVDGTVEIPPAGDTSFEEWISRGLRIICAPNEKTGKRILEPKLLLELVDSSIQNPNISLQFIADRFDVSESLISKAFKEIGGIGFNKYINTRRIEMAKNLLLEAYDVTMVAKMVGYGNDTTFRRCFESETGLSPSEYKRKNFSIAAYKT